MAVKSESLQTPASPKVEFRRPNQPQLPQSGGNERLSTSLIALSLVLFTASIILLWLSSFYSAHISEEGQVFQRTARDLGSNGALPEYNVYRKEALKKKKGSKPRQEICTVSRG